MVKSKITPYERSKRLRAIRQAKREIAEKREALQRFGVTKFKTFTRINAEGDVNAELMFQLPACNCGNCGNKSRTQFLPFSRN